MTITTDIPPIVLVEDSDNDFDTVLKAACVSGLPANARLVNNGDECLALLRCRGAERLAFVMMDLNTSGTAGCETLRQIKADPRLKAIPVVVVTTLANPHGVDFRYKFGANACHVKPVSDPDHLQMLTGLLAYWLVKVLKPTAQRLAP